MKIAVPYNNGMVFQHFGKSTEFKIYDVADFKVTNSQVVKTTTGGHSALSEFLRSNLVNCVICGGIGEGAKNMLDKFGIEIYPGVSGDADLAVEKMLNGTLIYNVATVCNHHHGEEHSCSGDCHGCH
ncbi:MAG: NifB/NifX family molybdenum-iron cluster-binding protein [Acutalibacteraceae bacterium]|nr:NifB/NifX family molybdenum-iron cluster-binding protein [Acutalibacteraceae bacterium]